MTVIFIKFIYLLLTYYFIFNDFTKFIEAIYILKPVIFTNYMTLNNNNKK